MADETADETSQVEATAPDAKPLEIPVEKEVENASNTETLKKKRKRNKKKSNAAGDDEEKPEIVAVKEEPKVEPKAEALPEPSDEATAGSNDTLKKGKKNKNKNKNKASDESSLVVEEVKVEEPKVDAKLAERIEPQAEALKNDPRKGKNKKRGDSKKSILDELQERQEREQLEAKTQLQNEIVKREKLLEKIDMVLDCKKSEAKVAQDQQESLKDLSELASKSAPVAAAKEPEQDALVDKIEQVLGVTKLELKNVQNQQAFVGRLETELAKVKETKEKYFRGETAEASTSADPKLPEHIEKLNRGIKDVKDVKPKKKEDLIKEIESRDILMAEINKVLDTTKNEIEKVQKQQKIIANLETELHKIKEAEISEKILEVTEKMEKEEAIAEHEPLPTMKPSSASASLLDALMANVGKLKEAQALKQQQKEEAKEVFEEVKKQEQKPVESQAVVIKKQKTVELSKNLLSEKIAKLVDSKIEEIKVEQPNVEELIQPLLVEDQPAQNTSPRVAKKAHENKKSQIDHKKNQKKEKSPAREEPIVVKHVEALTDDTEPEPVVEKEIAKKVESLKKAEKPKVDVKPEVKVEALSEPKVEVKPEVKTETKVEPTPEIKAEPKLVKIEVKPEFKIESKADVKAAVNPEVKVVPKAEIKIEAKPEIKIGNSTKPPVVESLPEPPKAEKPKQELVEEVKKVAATVEPAKVEPAIELPKPLETPAVQTPKPHDKKDKNKKDSPKNSQKNNKNNQHKKNAEKKEESPKVEPVTAPISNEASSPWGKPSMAEMLKKAPDPEPEEIKLEKPNEQSDQAPLAVPESLLEKPKPMVVQELVEPVIAAVQALTVAATPTPKAEPAPLVNVELPKVESTVCEPAKPTNLESCKMDESMVMVEKSDVVEAPKQLETNDKTDSKNVEGSGFASHAEEKDVKPLVKEEEKVQPGKSKSPVKNVAPKSPANKASPNKASANKPAAVPKTKPAPTKAPEVKKPTAKPAAKNSANGTETKDAPIASEPAKASSPVNASTAPAPSVPETSVKPAPPASPEKPKVALKPDVAKNGSSSSSPSRTPQKPGNGNPSPAPAPKSKTPSPVKPPVTKPAPPPSTAKPKPTVPPRPANTKPAPNTKQTKQPPQKSNGTKTSTPQAAATASVTLTR